jgi:hypothetical protein
VALARRLDEVAGDLSRVDLELVPALVRSHVSVGKGFEAVAADGIVLFRGWMPVRLGKLVLRVGTLGGPPPERALECVPALPILVAQFGPDVGPSSGHVGAGGAQGSGPCIDAPVELPPVSEGVANELAAVDCHDQEGGPELGIEAGNESSAVGGSSGSRAVNLRGPEAL